VDFVAVMDQVITLLRQRGRLTFAPSSGSLLSIDSPGGLSAWDMMCISNQWQCPWYEKLVKATRLGAPQRCGVSPAQGPVETVCITRYYTALFWIPGSWHLRMGILTPSHFAIPHRSPIVAG